MKSSIIGTLIIVFIAAIIAITVRACAEENYIPSYRLSDNEVIVNTTPPMPLTFNGMYETVTEAMKILGVTSTVKLRYQIFTVEGEHGPKWFVRFYVVE
jgi:hypothetical protein